LLKTDTIIPQASILRLAEPRAFLHCWSGLNAWAGNAQVILFAYK